MNSTPRSDSPTDGYSRRPVPRVAAALLVMLATAALAACTSGPAAAGPPSSRSQVAASATASPATTAPAPASPSARPSVDATTISVRAATGKRGAARAALVRLKVKGRAPMTGYRRSKFGAAWTDGTSAPLGHNGCGTRDDILARQLSHVRKSGSCKVLSGTEVSPYTKAGIKYRRGHSTVDIDHVVALGDAWQTGAQKWSAAKRARLANDPLNLLAVDMSSNRQKGDADAASWLPKNKSFRCSYVARQVAVKRAYGLWVTSAEKSAIARLLAACPTTTLPTGGAGRYDARHAPKAGGSAPTSKAPAPSNVYYANCDAVRAAHKAPLHRGQPGYDGHLDRDGDGVACE